MNDEWLKEAILLAKQAGQDIMKYHTLPNEAVHVAHKKDNTPVTAADLCAHVIIYRGLQTLIPQIPILSEEGNIPRWEIRRRWERYWLLDPLDGTRGFVERHDDAFTVNIALIEHHRPILGVVYAPVPKECYFAKQKYGVFKQVNDESPKRIHTKSMNWESFSVLLGQYLRSSRLPKLFKSIAGCQVICLNSSLKFCRVAEGDGDLYPRFGDTSEWDTAAAQCILEVAGGGVLDLNGKALQYNARASLVNPAFVAMGDLTQKIRIMKLVEERRRAK